MIKQEFDAGIFYNSDTFEAMKLIPDNSVDMILADLPYGTTACKWDTVIPFEPLWREYHRMAKERAAIVLTASQPFTSALVMSNIDNFKYEWIWDKKRGSNFASVKFMPFKEHENVCVFYRKSPTYNPQKIYRTESSLKRLPVGKEGCLKLIKIKLNNMEKTLGEKQAKYPMMV